MSKGLFVALGVAAWMVAASSGGMSKHGAAVVESARLRGRSRSED